MQCDYCDKKIIIQVKCPSYGKSDLVRGQKNSSLERVYCKSRLQRNHSYHFQVQAQMNVCDIEDVVWSERDIMIERDVLPFGSFGEGGWGGALSTEYRY